MKNLQRLTLLDQLPRARELAYHELFTTDAGRTWEKPVFPSKPCLSLFRAV